MLALIKQMPPQDGEFLFRRVVLPLLLHAFAPYLNGGTLSPFPTEPEQIGDLAALRKYGAFHRSELARFSALSKENRAATNSYPLGAMETAETEEAGQRFHKRLAKERSDE